MSGIEEKLRSEHAKRCHAWSDNEPCDLSLEEPDDPCLVWQGIRAAADLALLAVQELVKRRAVGEDIDEPLDACLRRTSLGAKSLIDDIEALRTRGGST